MLNPYFRSLFLALVYSCDVDKIADQLVEMGWIDSAIKPKEIKAAIELLKDWLIFDQNAEIKTPF